MQVKLPNNVYLQAFRPGGLLGPSKFFLQKVFITTVICLLALGFSCGMVDDESLDTSVLNLEELQPACPIKAEDLADILDRELSKEINCIEKNLLKFTSFVKLANRKEIKKEELEAFVNKFLSSNPEEVRSYLNILFKLNSLALKDKENTMQVDSISDFVDLIRKTNKYGSKVKRILNQIDEDNYLDKREELVESLRDLSRNLLETIQKKNPNGFQIDIISLLEEIKAVGKIDDEDLNIAEVQDLLFLKRLILGGNSLNFTSVDFEKTIGLSAELIKIYFDLVEAKKRSFVKQSSFYRFLLTAVNELNDIVMDRNDDEVYFFDTDLINSLNMFLGGRDWHKVGLSIQIFKMDILGGEANFYNKSDISNLFNYAKEIFESLYFYGYTYEQLEHILRKNEVINELDFPDSSEYRVISPERLVPLWHDFVEVARTYRTFPQENNLTLYSYKFNRSRWGFLLQSLLRYAGEKIFSIYYSDVSKDGEYSINKEQIRNIALDYKDALQEFELWPENLERLVNELLMGSDLFQFSSNGDLLLQRVEIAQYLPTVIGSNIIGKEIHERLETYCLPDENLSYKVECYRNNFFPSLFFDMDKIENFPNFFGYYSTATWGATQKYLVDAEKMSRIDADPLVPMTKVDLSRLVTSMSNTEGLFVKYDKNEDGVLDINELDQIFEVLRMTLAEEAKLKPSSKLLRSVYLYIVKKQKRPSKAGLLWFHVFGKKNNIKADRNTIAGVLKMFGFKKK